MDPRLALMCDWFGSQSGTTVGMACLALGALVLTLIILGFGPLRSWLARVAARGSVRRGVTPGDADLVGTWRLYRRLQSGARGDGSRSLRPIYERRTYPEPS